MMAWARQPHAHPTHSIGALSNFGLDFRTARAPHCSPMNHTDTQTVMIAIAVATPLVGLAAWVSAWLGARTSGERVARRVCRNAALLAAAGPLNLLVWFAFNRWLDARGARSVTAIVAAAVVFVVAGFLTGWFTRRPREK